MTWDKEENPCNCGRGERLDGEHYCEECLKENPFLCV